MNRIVVPLAAISLGLAPAVTAQQPVSGKHPELVTILAWMDSHLVPYRNRETYETGRDDVMRSIPPREALAIYAFDLPVSHTHWRFLGRFRRCWAYDTALAVSMYSMVGDFSKARGLLMTLEHLQNPDGSIGFSWNTSSNDEGADGFYNRSYVRTGTVAWVGYAALLYERLSGDRRFRRFAEKTAAFVLSQQIKAADDRRFGLVLGGYGTWSPDYSKLDRKAVVWAGAEHQYDSWFFLRDLGRITGTREYQQAAELLKAQIVKVLWDDHEGRFHVGVDKEKSNNDRALDASSWGAIFLAAVGETQKARRALEYVDRAFLNSTEGIKGYKAYSGIYHDHPIRNWNEVRMVWSEGSLGVSLAWHRLGDKKRSREIEADISAMQEKPGGVRYAAYADDLPVLADALKRVAGMRPTDPLEEFLRCPSAAGTVWLGLVRVTRLTGSDAFWGAEQGDDRKAR